MPTKPRPGALRYTDDSGKVVQANPGDTMFSTVTMLATEYFSDGKWKRIFDDLAPPAGVVFDPLRAEFEAWAIRAGHAYRNANGFWFYRNGGDGLFEAFKAGRGSWPPCPGKTRPGCNYLAACGTICNKCGRSH